MIITKFKTTKQKNKQKHNYKPTKEIAKTMQRETATKLFSSQ